MRRDWIHIKSHPFKRFKCPIGILVIHFSGLRNIIESLFKLTKIVKEETSNLDSHAFTCYKAAQNPISENPESNICGSNILYFYRLISIEEVCWRF
jgi:hypothetical protein